MPKLSFQIGLFYRLIFLLLVASNSVFAQVKPLPKQNEQAILIHSKVMGADRTIWVHLPADYDNAKSYPVLYVLDADKYFNYSSELVESLSNYDCNRIPEMIVVGIVNVEREKDFTPVYLKKSDGLIDSTRTSEIEGAGRFLKYLNTEVVPYVETHFQAIPYRVLAGHALGGLFAFYGQKENPSLFPALIITSPEVNNLNEYLMVNLEAKEFKSKLRIFFGVGNEKTDKLEAIKDALSNLRGNRPYWGFNKYKEDNQFSTPFKSMSDGLKYIFSEWFIDFHGKIKFNYSFISSRFYSISEQFGFKVSPPEKYVRNCGYNQLRQGYYSNAIQIFTMNVEDHSRSYEAYNSLAEAFMKVGDSKKAIENYKKSLEINRFDTTAKKKLIELSQLK